MTLSTLSHAIHCHIVPCRRPAHVGQCGVVVMRMCTMSLGVWKGGHMPVGLWTWLFGMVTCSGSKLHACGAIASTPYWTRSGMRQPMHWRPMCHGAPWYGIIVQCALKAFTCRADIYIFNDTFSHFQGLFIDSYQDEFGNSKPES